MYLEQARHVRDRRRLVSRRACIVVEGRVEEGVLCSALSQSCAVLKFKIRFLNQPVGFEVRQLLRLWQLCIVSVLSMQAFGLCLSKAVMTNNKSGCAR
jgi:hypothetical protein